ncbi:Golgi phosphoprotein 3-domain-containing protein [Pisolithus marmoratus]|nr:Golgi phosphoprotein 3-domain-containing protein [Pisolithus marmoratus]
MSSAGGLSRRRVANTTSSSDDASGSTWHANGSTSNGPVLSHAGSAFEGGNKIAEESRTGGKLPRLTIMEEILLLGLKDKHGYLSFGNDSISYALRGCILMELALRRRIALVKDVNRRKYPIGDRIVEVIDDRQTGETILDETLKMMKAQEVDSGKPISLWMHTRTWNVMKIVTSLSRFANDSPRVWWIRVFFRTEKRNFLLFDMATHPVADIRSKDAIITRVVTSTIPPMQGYGGAICLVCAAYAASVLDNALGRLTYEDREAAFQRCDDILAGVFVHQGSGWAAQPQAERESVLGLLQEVKREMNGEEDLGFELIAGVLEVLSKLDSLL